MQPVLWGGHGFDSRRGVRIFLCPMLVSLLKKIISKFQVRNVFVISRFHKTRRARSSRVIFQQARKVVSGKKKWPSHVIAGNISSLKLING